MRAALLLRIHFVQTQLALAHCVITSVKCF